MIRALTAYLDEAGRNADHPAACTAAAEAVAADPWEVVELAGALARAEMRIAEEALSSIQSMHSSVAMRLEERHQGLRVVDEAFPPNYPSAPRRKLLTILAAGLGFILACVFAVLVGRLVQVQLVCGTHYREVAKDIHEETVKIAPKRGDIRDRNGVLLARSLSTTSVCASPRPPCPRHPAPARRRPTSGGRTGIRRRRPRCVSLRSGRATRARGACVPRNSPASGRA